MLKELKKYKNLGTPTYFWEFLNLFKKNKLWTEITIKEYFFNKRIDDRIIFDGCIPLLKATNIILIDADKSIQLEYSYRNIVHSKEFCQQKLLEGFLNAFQEDKEFSNIFKNTHYDYLISKAIVVNASSFGLKYSNIRKLLIDFDFLRPYEGMRGKYIINPRKKKYFEKNIVPKIRKIMGIEELKKQLKQQELNGEEAEKYVLAYEKIRLNNKNGIEWIAPYDSTAGFDIISYHDQDDDENNRFIEVKSYTGVKPYFYWTKNEMKKAKDRGYDYAIYLVCRERMNDDTYHPIIIHDPFSNILESEEWAKEIDKYYITSL